MADGQIPFQTTPFTVRPTLDPELTATLTDKPPPVTLERMLDRPVVRPQDAVSGLGLSKAAEHSIALRIAKEAAQSPNRLRFAQGLNATMAESGVSRELQAVIGSKAQQYYASTLQKSGRYETFSLLEAAELRKGKMAPLKPSFTLKPDPGDVKAEKKANDEANKEAGLDDDDVKKSQEGYPRLYIPGEKSREKKLRKKAGLEKAFETSGGKYVARVTKDGKHKYYYDEKKYKEEHGEHVTGEQARNQHIHAEVEKAVDNAGCAGCDVTAFRELVQKFGHRPVHAAVRNHVEKGTLKYKSGKFTRGSKPKEDKVKKSDVLLYITEK